VDIKGGAIALASPSFAVPFVVAGVGSPREFDLGLRLADVQAMRLQSEGAASSKSSAAAIRARLRDSGATPEECEFLVHQRVELNAMTSEQFVEFIERKLTEHGIEKIVPSKQTLDKAYQLFERSRRLEETFDKMAKELETADARAPDDIKNRVTEIMRKRPRLRWDAAVMEGSRTPSRRLGTPRLGRPGVGPADPTLTTAKDDDACERSRKRNDWTFFRRGVDGRLSIARFSAFPIRNREPH